LNRNPAWMNVSASLSAASSTAPSKIVFKAPSNA
jgi:hypothetical protein